MTRLSITLMTTMVAVLVSICSQTVLAQEAQTKTNEVAPDQCRQLLQKSVIDFFDTSSLDSDNLGFHESIDDSGKFVPGNKFLVLQARQTWFFSHLAVNQIDRISSIAAAELGYGCLQENFHDKELGGYILITDSNGKAVDDRKHVYPMCFVIYALVEMHRISDAQQPLDDAMELFKEIDKRCYDKEQGGYQELFANDWQLIDDPEQWGVVSTAGTKTYNSHLHIMEAFTELYRETKNELVGKRLEELIAIVTTTIRHPEFPCNIDGWTPNWKLIETPKNLRASYGHDLECIWLVLEANDALGRSSTLYKNWAVAMCDHAIQFGYDPNNGGFYSGGPLGKPADDRTKVWWVQAEALVGLLTMEKLTGDSKYRDLFEQTYRFIEKHHVSKAGGWWANLNEDGSVGESKMRASMWKGAYHDGRALIRCEKLLRELDSAEENK